jgi:hypothetical protein
MIINHSKRFIFFHVPKTGGTSVQAALRAVPGSRKPSGSKHLTPAEYRADRFTHWRTRHYFTFCFVRNPLERFGSLHRYVMGRGQHDCPHDVNDFAAMLADGVAWVLDLRSIRPQSEYARHVTFTGRYERLEDDLSEVCGKLGINIELPHKNASGGTQRYTDQYTPRTIDILTDFYQDDFTLSSASTPM